MEDKKVIITQSNYIPWKGYFDSINLVDEVVLYDDMQYTKRDWRNRNKIKTSNGLSWLTIPVEVKGKFNQKINETMTVDNHWRINHWRTIEANYKSAPYFHEYSEVFKALYLESDEKNLSEINFQFIKVVNEVLGIRTVIRRSSEFELIEGKTERLADLCEKLNAKVYYTGPSAKNYIEKKPFTDRNIELAYLDFSGYNEYPQLFGEFEHAVSILDLIFNCGEESTKYLKNF